MNTQPIDASYVFCRLLLAFPKDHIYIADSSEIVGLLKQYSNKPPYAKFLSRVVFKNDFGKITCPSIENTIEEMKGFMLIPIDGSPNKFTINKAEISDFILKFSNSENIDEFLFVKLAKDFDRKINSRWDYKTIKDQFSKKATVSQEVPVVEEQPLEKKNVEHFISEDFTPKIRAEEVASLGIFGQAENDDSLDDLIEGV